MTESPNTPESADIDPNSSPWRTPPVEGISFDDDSEEAKAIERIIKWSESEAEDRARPGDD